MSKENVEVVRAMFEAYSAGDMDAFRELHDPNVIMRPPKGWPEPGPFVGREAAMRQFEQLGETFDSHSLGPISGFIDAGDRVVVRVAYHGEGHGPEMNFELTQVITVREGRILYREAFRDHAEALEALGLPYKGASQENVEVVRRWLATLNGGFEKALASLPEFCEPDIDYYPLRKFPEARPCHGLDEFSRFFAQYLDAWRIEVAIHDLIEVGDERVLVRETLRTEGRGSGVELEGELYQCFWLRHGRVFRQEDHLTLRGALHAFGLDAETLEAAGLSE
jgi:ketosteroid isomerase-like protein